MDRRSIWVRAWKNHRWTQALQNRRFDLAIDFSASHRSAQLISGAKPGLKVGLGLAPLKGFYDLTAKGEDELSVPATQLDRRVLNLLGLDPKPHDRPGGYWRPPPSALEYAQTFWKAHRFSENDLVLAINPFASCKAKEWYPRYWAAVLKELLANGVKAFFTCAPLEKKGIGAIEKELSQSLPLYSGSSVLPLLGLYQKAKAVLSVDSGPRHLAAAVGTPTLTIWGPESVKRWHPYSPENHPVVLKSVPCRPCGLSVCVEMKHQCMVDLSPEDVLKKLKQLLMHSWKA
jgi:ADP-heptose:LPS heptosyltransferase